MQIDFEVKELISRAKLSLPQASIAMRRDGVDINNPQLALFANGFAVWPDELRRSVLAWLKKRINKPIENAGAPLLDIVQKCRELGHTVEDLARWIDDVDHPCTHAVVSGLREPPCGFDMACRNVFKIWTAERGDQVPAIGAGEGGQW